jgi:2-amino-4-hydroxy-6-hydroxymethyldihydropteridine diphosphokinase
MSLIIASGSNIGDSLKFLDQARIILCQQYDLVAASRVYRSAAVDYTDQPDFFNQVLEFRLPEVNPLDVMNNLLQIEESLGRKRDLWRGPRTIDLDIIFWGLTRLESEPLIIPHPRWAERSFVVRPLEELPFFQTIKKCFTIPESFKVEAKPIN